MLKPILDGPRHPFFTTENADSRITRSAEEQRIRLSNLLTKPTVLRLFLFL
jgi:hypothetical protein